MGHSLSSIRAVLHPFSLLRSSDSKQSTDSFPGLSFHFTPVSCTSGQFLSFSVHSQVYFCRKFKVPSQHEGLSSDTFHGCAHDEEHVDFCCQKWVIPRENRCFVQSFLSKSGDKEKVQNIQFMICFLFQPY